MRSIVSGSILGSREFEKVPKESFWLQGTQFPKQLYGSPAGPR